LTDLSHNERIVLDLAAVLAEELHDIKAGKLPDRVTTMEVEDYVKGRVPETWEFVDGRPEAKHWAARVEHVHRLE
jgi:hypothetical protein